MYKANGAVRVNEVQRDLNLSSPSVAQYHLQKLLRLGLIRQDSQGYVIDKVVFENVLRFRRTSIPFQAAYTTFFAASLLLLLTLLRPPIVNAAYFYAILAICIALVIAIFETRQVLKRLS